MKECQPMRNELPFTCNAKFALNSPSSKWVGLTIGVNTVTPLYDTIIINHSSDSLAHCRQFVMIWEDTYLMCLYPITSESLNSVWLIHKMSPCLTETWSESQQLESKVAQQHQLHHANVYNENYVLLDGILKWSSGRETNKLKNATWACREYFSLKHGVFWLKQEQGPNVWYSIICKRLLSL